MGMFGLRGDYGSSNYGESGVEENGSGNKPPKGEEVKRLIRVRFLIEKDIIIFCPHSHTSGYVSDFSERKGTNYERHPHRCISVEK